MNASIKTSVKNISSTNTSNHGIAVKLNFDTIFYFGVNYDTLKLCSIEAIEGYPCRRITLNEHTFNSYIKCTQYAFVYNQFLDFHSYGFMILKSSFPCRYAHIFLLYRWQMISLHLRVNTYFIIHTLFNSPDFIAHTQESTVVATSRLPKIHYEN